MTAEYENFPGNPPNEKDMDTHNNNIGHQLGQYYASIYDRRDAEWQAAISCGKLAMRGRLMTLKGSQSDLGSNVGESPQMTPTPGPSPSLPVPTVTLSPGDSAQGQPHCRSAHCRFMVVSLHGFDSGLHRVECWSTLKGTPFVSFSTTVWPMTRGCYYGYPGEQVWVTVDGVQSNKVTWPSAS